MQPGSIKKILNYFAINLFISFYRKEIEESAKMSGAHDFIIKLQDVIDLLLQ